MTGNVIIAILFSVTFLVGIIVCLICNMAISGSLTWSLIPVSSIVFLWIIVGVFKHMGKTRMLTALGTTFLLLILAFVSFLCGRAKKR